MAKMYRDVNLIYLNACKFILPLQTLSIIQCNSTYIVLFTMINTRSS
jgi:hypothetical protein